ncbi:hypothetical protein GCM10010191_48550 [Actinomadura vinacea]|uniref:Uncharacterized protein n=1 Tax=Actinomadura vinacea TaxID=115336 RepID=A0ABN3JG60_9ACTN
MATATIDLSGFDLVVTRDTPPVEDGRLLIRVAVLDGGEFKAEIVDYSVTVFGGKATIGVISVFGNVTAYDGETQVGTVLDRGRFEGCGGTNTVALVFDGGHVCGNVDRMW